MKRGAAVKLGDGRPAIFLARFGWKKKMCTVLNEHNKIEQASYDNLIQVEDKDEANAIVEKILNIEGAAGKRKRRAMAENHQVDLFG